MRLLPLFTLTLHTTCITRPGRVRVVVVSTDRVGRDGAAHGHPARFTSHRRPTNANLAFCTGIFELIACLMIFVMGITMLKMDRAKAKWRVKLQKAFAGQRASHRPPSSPAARHIL